MENESFENRHNREFRGQRGNRKNGNWEIRDNWDDMENKDIKKCMDNVDDI